MINPEFSPEQLIQLAALARSNRPEALGAAGIIVDCAVYVNKSLLRQMHERYGLFGELSPMAESSYDDRTALMRRLRKDSELFQDSRFAPFIHQAFDNSQQIVTEINRQARRFPTDQGTAFLQAVKPMCTNLAASVLLVSEVIGSGQFDPQINRVSP